jgi:hypothetical protein
MPTKIKPATAQNQFEAAQKRLDKATADGVAAQERLDGLRERHKADGDVTAEEFAKAAAVLELADLDRQGAGADFATAKQAARMESFAELRVDIERRADPAIAAAAFERAADALAELIKETGPARSTRISEWAGQLNNLGIQPTSSYDRKPPVAEDDGFASNRAVGGGRIDSIALTTSSGEKRTVRASRWSDAMLASLVERACSKAGDRVGKLQLLELGNGDQSLTQDPGEWFKHHG